MLYPMLALIIFTILVCASLGILRFLSVQKRQVNPKLYLLMSGYDEPNHLKKINRHYINLLEQPILFYLACILAISQDIQSSALIYLSWSYLAVRLIHSLIHMSYNNALHRMGVFSISMLILLAIWVQLALTLSA
jgi:hypothetical protein